MKEKIIEIKTPKEIEILKECAKIASDILEHLNAMLQSGISTFDLETEARKEMSGYGVDSAFMGYRGYPSVLCVSINDELVHGIPKKTKKIKNGDIVSIDIGIRHRGFIGDVAATCPVGSVSAVAEKLLAVGSGVFEVILENSTPEKRLGDISHAIDSYIKKRGFSVVRDYEGHGIGRELHEAPPVPNFGSPGSGPRLKAGMVLAVEPMLCEGSWELTLDSDNWTVRTKDGKLCSHFEHMIVVDEKPQILTHW